MASKRSSRMKGKEMNGKVQKSSKNGKSQKKKIAVNFDKEILQILHKDARIPVQQIASKIDEKYPDLYEDETKTTAASTIHYRLKKMKESGLIEGFYTQINPEKVNRDFMHIIQVRTSTAVKNFRQVGNDLAKIDGIWSVYFILGDWDFILLCRSANRKEYLKVLEAIANTKNVERSSSLSVAEVIKEDPRIKISDDMSF